MSAADMECRLGREAPLQAAEQLDIVGIANDAALSHSDAAKADTSEKFDLRERLVIATGTHPELIVVEQCRRLVIVYLETGVTGLPLLPERGKT